MLKTEKSTLTAAISAVIGVVSRTSKVPIMQNICIERDGSELVLRGGSMDVEIASRLDVVFDDTFEDFTLPAHLLEDAVRRMADGAELRFDRVDQDDRLVAVNIRAGRSRVKLPILPASDFPKLDAGSLPYQLSMNTGTLMKKTKAVQHAVCTDLTRYYLAGVLFQPAVDGLRVVATDGHRLAVRFVPAIEIDQADELASIPQVIVPTKVIDRALKVMDGEQDVVIDISSQKIRVAAGRTVMVGKLIEGVYPDYRRIKPSSDAIRVAFSSAALSAAIGRVLVVTPDAGNGVAFRATREGLAINARDYAVGDADDEIPCEVTEECSGGFQGRQMLEALEGIDGDQVECFVSPAALPMLLRIPGDTENYTILMPMQPKGGRTQS